MIDQLEIKVKSKGIYPFNRGEFSGKVLNSENYKIYIVKHNNQFVYIGKTNQTIGEKFRQSFSSYLKAKKGEKKVGGYSGYKWIKKYINKNISLSLHVFDLGKTGDNQTEAIEAEIVFIIRETTKRWPECQHEIHFHNKFMNAHKKALEILNLIN